MRLTTPRRLTIAALATIGALFGTALIAAPAAAAPPYIVTNNASSGQGSLPQEVADAVADGGGEVTFDMSTVTTPINLTAAIPTITQDVTITGPGIGQLTVNTYNGGIGLLITGDDNTLTMTDISFDSLSAATDGVSAVEANLDFENVSVSGYGNIGVSVVDGEFLATDCYFSNNGGGGVLWQGSNDPVLENLDFTDVTVNNNGAGGIQVNPSLGVGDLDFVRVNAQLNNGPAIDINGPGNFGLVYFEGGEYQQNNSGISIGGDPDPETVTAASISFQDVNVHDNEGQGINLNTLVTDTTFSGVHSDGNGTLSPVAGGGLQLNLWDSDFAAYNSSFNDNTGQFTGGGVYIELVRGESAVTFDHTEISGNTIPVGVTSTGGGVGVGTIVGNGDPDSFLNFVDSWITGNTAAGDGGGIFIDHMGNGVGYYGQLYISNTTIDDNESTTGDGGGISINEFAHQTTTEFPFIYVQNSTISNNRAPDGDGGAFYFDKNGSSGDLAWVKFENSTISGNDADFGGAGVIDTGDDDVAYVTLDIDVSTFTNNSSGFVPDPDLLFNLTNSIFSGNGSGPDLNYVPGENNDFFSAYNNVGEVEAALTAYYLSGTGNQLGKDPLLGPLADNGGPTLTHLPQAGSPVFNAGDPAFMPPPSIDQRGDGFPRILQGRVDMGSVESLGPLPATGGELNPLWAAGALLLLLAGAALVLVRRRAA